MSNKRKLVHLTYDMRIGGTETVIKQLVEGIDNSKYDVEILCIEPNLGPFGKQLQMAGINITNLNWVGGFNFKLILEIRKYIKNKKVDILHCHQYTPWFYGVLAAALTSAAVIFTEHGRFYPDRTSWKRKVINPFLLLFTNQVTAISKATKLALNEFEFIPKDKISVIYNGIEGLQREPDKSKAIKNKYNVEDNSIVFGTVARLDPIKNQTLMIEAFNRVHQVKSSAKLLIVGDGEERTKLENLVLKLELQESVIFAGYITEPKDYIACMDIFLLSSLSEGTSMTLLEALSLSIPCVVTDAGGNSEVIDHKESGLVTENSNELAFSEAMLDLAENREALSEYSLSAYKAFEERFKVTKMASEYQAIYASVIKN